MNCCVNCFSDPGLKSRIVAASSKKGTCNFCETKNTELARCEDLSEHFEAIFDLYNNHPTAELSLKKKVATLLYEHLEQYWPTLFNKTRLDSKMIMPLIDQIGRGGNLYSVPLFEEPVELKLLIDPSFVSSDDWQLKWESFSDEIKNRNRFFLSERIDTDTLESVFERLAITYPTDTIFFRARISEEPLDISKLGKPPADSTTPGRANPVGIPYLYVSESEETTLYETRIALHENVSIGEFVTREPLNLVSLKNIANFAPFEILDKGFTLEEFIRIRPYLQKLENELSKPVRKQDVHLDYLPTQFLCEHIKSLGFDAVEYKSAMRPNGFNLAIFNDQKLECVAARFYTVSNLEYKWS